MGYAKQQTVFDPQVRQPSGDTISPAFDECRVGEVPLYLAVKAVEYSSAYSASTDCAAIVLWVRDTNG